MKLLPRVRRVRWMRQLEDGTWEIDCVTIEISWLGVLWVTQDPSYRLSLGLPDEDWGDR